MIGATLRAALFFSLVAAAYFGPSALSGALPVFRDLMVLFVPLHSWRTNALAIGESVLWCPDLFFGAPFLASYQSAVLYPPTLVFLVFPFPVAIGVYLALHLAVAGLGASLLLRRTFAASEAAALLGGITFALGGYFVSLLSLTNQLAAAAWLPWLLLAADRLARRRDTRSLAAFALLLTLPALAGAPETVLLTVALAVVVASESAGPAARGTAVGLVVVASALAAAAVAVQLAPTFEYYRETQRAAGLSLADVGREALSLRSFEQLLLPPTIEDGAPRLYPEGGIPLVFSLYVGVVPLVLAFAGARLRSSWTWVAIVSALAASAAATPLLALAHAIAPPIAGAFRYPVKLFLPAHFALAVLAAAGLDRMLAGEARVTTRAAVTAVVLAAAGAVVVVLGTTAPDALFRTLGYELRADLAAGALEILAAPLVALGGRLAVLALLVAFLGVAARRGWIGAGLAGAIVVAIGFVDLWGVQRGPWITIDGAELHESMPRSEVGIAPDDRLFHYCTAGFGCGAVGDRGLGSWVGSVRALDPVEPRARRLWRTLVPDVPLVYGLGAVAGTDGFATEAQRDFANALVGLPRDRAAHLLRALGVRWLVGQQPLEIDGVELRLADAGSGTHFYEVRDAAPRTYVAGTPLLAPDRMSALARVAAADFTPGGSVVLEGPGSMDPFGSGVIDAVEFTGARIRGIVHVDTGGWWIVNDTFFPGWEATVDGRPAEIVRANGVARAVRVPAGKHRVEMHYRPRSLEIGTAISVVALLGIVGLAVLRWPRP